MAICSGHIRRRRPTLATGGGVSEDRKAVRVFGRCLPPARVLHARTRQAGRSSKDLFTRYGAGEEAVETRAFPNWGTHTPLAPPRKHALSLADNAVAIFHEQSTTHLAQAGQHIHSVRAAGKKRADPEVYRQTAASRRIARLERFDHAAKSAQIAGRFYCAANMCEALPERMADVCTVANSKRGWLTRT